MMPTVVVPFRGTEGKGRLRQLPPEDRAVLGQAMLADVLAACVRSGAVYLVTPDDGPFPGATIVHDQGAGQGVAVQSGLSAAVGAGAGPPYLIVNADLPCVTARDLLALAGAIPDHGLALAAAADGTTNALALASAELFAPLYGPGSAARFAALAPSRTLDVPNLIDDVDTLDDLKRLRARLGAHTSTVLSSLHLGAAA
jgi:2-phospho-L-lactate/phosphoenolpyruvate guanylyltransferase